MRHCATRPPSCSGASSLSRNAPACRTFRGVDVKDTTKHSYEFKVTVKLRCDRCCELTADVQTRKRYYPCYGEQTSCHDCFLATTRELLEDLKDEY